MNIRNIDILKTLAALLLCVATASCSQQDELDMGHGNTLPPGKYPLMFTATVEGMLSRADEPEPAPWVEDDEIAVQIDDYPASGRYMLNEDGSLKESDTPLSWPYEKGFVKAWYPFVKHSETKELEIVDQSNGFHNIDFLYAKSEEKRYNQTVDLVFKHQMAKVRCKFIKGDGVTDEDLKTAEVSYYGYPKAKFSEDGVYGVGDNAWITSTSDHSALLVPQDVSGLPFITVDLTLTINDARIPKTLVYTPQETMNLEAGKAYTFNIKVQKDRLEVQTISGAWTESPDATEPTSDKYQIYLPENTEELGELEFSKNVITEVTADTRAGSGRYLEVLGDSFTISYKVTLDNCHLGPVFVDNSKNNQVVRIYYEKESEGYYEFIYKIASPIGEPVYLEKDEYMEVGDILFLDGKWGNIPEKIYDGKKIPVGMVFKIGAGDNDTPANYNDCEGWNGHEIRGYAVALNDASDVGVLWCTSSKQIFKTQENIGKYYSGLYVTNRIKEVLPTIKAPTLNISNFPPLVKAEEYNSNTASPEGSSGWYLPSYNQLLDIRKLFVHPQRRQWIPNAGGKFFESAAYWSATEQSSTNARAETFDYFKYIDHSTWSYFQAKIFSKYYVRTVLTF